MTRTITLTIDEQQVSVPPGTTILAAHEQLRSNADEPIPTLCYGATLTPKNACRLCVVEVVGSRTLVPACSRQVEDDMVVETRSERVDHARKLVLEFLGSSVDLSLTEHVDRWYRDYEADPDRLAGATHAETPVLVDNALYVRDYAKCILCYRCVDACGEQWQNSFVIEIAGRGFDAQVSTEFGVDLPGSACVYCGNCVEVCPTGALMGTTEFNMRAAGTWQPEQQTETDTVCGYCGVGCNLTLTVQDNTIVKVNSPADSPTTHGNLCIKGRFGYQHAQNRPAPDGDDAPH